jgi:hypothetical protein
MHILVGLCMGLALLYFWLLGHWFARALMFVVLGVTFGGACFFIVAANTGIEQAGFMAVPIGVLAAWFAAGAPTYYHRQPSWPLNTG